MTAVTIDVSVVDGSNTKVTANPIYPIQTPLNVGELAVGVLDAPVNITELAFGYIIAPINIAELSPGVVAAPVDINEVSVVDISAPADITELAALALSAPVDITELSPANISLPTDITELSAGVVSAPSEITELSNVDIDTPVNIPELAAGVLSVPADITEEGIGALVAPANITELSAGVLSSPVDITEESAGVVAVPVNITEETVADVAIPNDIAEVSPATLSVPNSITANALDPEVPPFSLKHARMLYFNKLIGSTVSTNAGLNGSFVLIPNTADRYTVTNGGAITFTLPANQDFDTVAIGAHNLGSESHSVGVEYSTGVSSAFIAFKTGQTPSNDTAMMFHNSSTVSARRIKVTVSGLGSIFIGSIYAGIALQMQRPFFAGHSPLPLSAKTIKYSSVTEGGNFVGEQIRRLGFRTSAPFKNLSNDWYRLYFQPFVIHARTLPFFFAWNLEQYPLDVGYCKINEDITPSYGSLDMFNVSFDMVGFG
jgi:hypothetical protein